MFSDVIQLLKIITDFIVDKNPPGKSRWKAVFRMYQDLETIIECSKEIVKALKWFDTMKKVPIFPGQTEKLNIPLRKLDVALKSFISAFGVGDVLAVYDKKIGNLYYRLAAKGTWLERFLNYYSSGEVDQSTRRIRQRLFKRIDQIDQALITKYKSDRDFVRSLETAMLIDEDLDLTDELTLQILIKDGEENIKELIKLHEALRKFIKDNCEIEYLL